MLLSRFWYVVLGAATAAALAAALLGQTIINARSDKDVSDALLRDRQVVNAVLKLEARERLDRIAFITIDERVGNILRQARGVTDPKQLSSLNAALKESLQSHVTRIVEAAQSEGKSAAQAKELEPDIVFALDGDGRIIAQLGPLAANPPGSGLGTYPLVKRALQGYLRDDVWVYDRRVYRMAARPVVSGSDYAGAIVHGYRFNDAFAERISAAVPGAGVSFFYGQSVLGSHAPGGPGNAAVGSDLPTVLAKFVKGKHFAQGDRSEPIDLPKGGRTVLSPIVGSAASAGVGYAITRARPVVADPWSLFREASREDVAQLPWPILVGVALALSLFGLLFVYVERDRNVRSLARRASEVTKGERDRLIITEWRGIYRKLADEINHALDQVAEKAGHVAPTRKKANLDEILGSTPEASGTPFFGFATEESPTDQIPSLDQQTGKKPPSPPAAPVIKPIQPAAAPPMPSLQPTTGPSLHPGAAGENGGSFDEDTHWREVYAQYVETRRQCGEPVNSLTFEKFGVTLKKTRDQLVEKHGAKGVRFSVQVKQGRAALKAQPVRK